ncbi:ABC transporter permease [Flavitalea flava]
MSESTQQRKWKEVITSRNTILSLNLKEIWEYRDLLSILMRRDILAIYKQTIFGPLWFFLQPVLTTLTYTIVFSNVAKLPTSNLPPVLFYLSGLILWSYFSECIIKTSGFFRDNSQILTKVYFPRLIVPLSLVLTNLLRFSIQLVLFFIIYVYFFVRGTRLEPNSFTFFLPFLVLLTALLGLGLGMIVSSLTTKYKDLMHLLTFGIQLLMFMSPVIFPLSSFDHSKFKILIMANPMTGIIEGFRYGFFGKGTLNLSLLGYDTGCAVIFLVLGLLIFNTVEKNFADNI